MNTETKQPKALHTEGNYDANFIAAMDAVAAYEKEIDDHNHKVLAEIGKTAKRNFYKLLDGSRVTGKVEIVDKPEGYNQDERHGPFTAIWVSQWTTGMGGDSYAGFIYAKFDKDKWLKIPYDC